MKPLTVGLFLLIAAMGLDLLSRRTAVRSDMSQNRVFTGITVALFAVGAFNVVGWLAGMFLTQSVDTDGEIFVRWLFAVPLILAFVLALSQPETIKKASFLYEQRHFRAAPAQPGLRYHRQIRQNRSL